MPSPRIAFTAQKHSAQRRGISFDLTFAQWLEIWQSSGRLLNRGAHKGQYVMARFRDRGPYAVGNVKIILFEDNIKEAVLHKTPDELAAWRAGLAKGGHANKGRARPDLAQLNQARRGKPLDEEHRQNIATAMLGKTRGRYKTWKGAPR
jgi:hypothetical protein